MDTNENQRQVAQSSRDGGNSLVEVVDRILDKGIVIDAWVSVSVIGIELVTIEARVIVASLDTYIKHAETLKYIGPVAGGFLAEKHRQTLGEAVGNLTQGVGETTKGLPVLGGMGGNKPQERNQPQSVSRKPSKRKNTRGRGRKRK